jgi:cbb3-type cytochrome oxidase maturation protein
MGVIPLLVVCSVVAAGCFLVAFLWATGSGQYDDIHTPALRMLFPERTILTEPTILPERVTDPNIQSTDHEH